MKARNSSEESTHEMNKTTKPVMNRDRTDEKMDEFMSRVQLDALVSSKLKDLSEDLQPSNPREQQLFELGLCFGLTEGVKIASTMIAESKGNA